MRTPARALSGGEQNRAILARLFSKPANLLVLDEPTNDLDIETLELLEEILLDFDGTVLLVSHDREFMDNVVTSLLVLPGDGTVEEQAGSYSDWESRGGRLTDPERQREKSRGKNGAKTAASEQPKANAGQATKQRKLSYKEQRELATLPAKIEQLETRIAELEKVVSGPGFYQGDRATVESTIAELTQLHTQLESAFERWTQLDG